ncbi:hypothetical protein BX666DRAFT_1530351 [Dichotomocladium elegans]|nr:hypothetical protein BX666DRAFT_1530351 [Dichotomocladium elegans]
MYYYQSSLGHLFLGGVALYLSSTRALSTKVAIASIVAPLVSIKTFYCFRALFSIQRAITMTRKLTLIMNGFLSVLLYFHRCC